MQWWEWLVGILLFIVALGVLIGIHELGHLGAAKLFRVYCFNYSIGFGPKLLSSKRSAKHETIWSLRAIPLGGFVAMYGEGAEFDEGIAYVPPSRSLEGVARYKRAVIISAGVFLNFVLGFVLIFLHNACFDHIYFDFYSPNNYETSIVVSSPNSSFGVSDGDALKLISEPLAEVSINKSVTTGVFLLDQNVTLPGEQFKDKRYVLSFKNSLSSTKEDPDLTTSFVINEALPIDDAINNAINAGYKVEYLRNLIITNNPEQYKTEESRIKLLNDLNAMDVNMRNARYKVEMKAYYEKLGATTSIKGDDASTLKFNSETPSEIKVNLTFYKRANDGNFSKDNMYTKEVTLKLNKDSTGWDPLDIGLKRYFERYSAGQTFKVTWDEWCSSNSAIFQALGRLFTGNTKDMGGILTIAVQSSQILSSFGFERYLFLWGTISCNLGIINLLPFPGLDGWQLVVIAYEALTKRQIPTKIKSIISLIGFVLLAGLMILILVQDIFRFI